LPDSRRGPASLRRPLLIISACSPTCCSSIVASSSARGTSAATESTTISTSSPERARRSATFQRLLAVVGLAEEQRVDRDADRRRVGGVEGLLGVDEGAAPASPLGLGDRVVGEGRLARRLGPVELDDAPARQAADAEGQVEREGRRSGSPRPRHGGCLPTSITAPAPNWRSIRASAPARSKHSCSMTPFDLPSFQPPSRRFAKSKAPASRPAVPPAAERP